MSKGFYSLIRLLVQLKVISYDDFIRAQILHPIDGDWYDQFDPLKSTMSMDPNKRWEDL